MSKNVILGPIELGLILSFSASVGWANQQTNPELTQKFKDDKTISIDFSEEKKSTEGDTSQDKKQIELSPEKPEPLQPESTEVQLATEQETITESVLVPADTNTSSTETKLDGSQIKGSSLITKEHRLSLGWGSGPITNLKNSEIRGFSQARGGHFNYELGFPWAFTTNLDIFADQSGKADLRGVEVNNAEFHFWQLSFGVKYFIPIENFQPWATAGLSFGNATVSDPLNRYSDGPFLVFDEEFKFMRGYYAGIGLDAFEGQWGARVSYLHQYNQTDRYDTLNRQKIKFNWGKLSLGGLFLF